MAAGVGTDLGYERNKGQLSLGWCPSCPPVDLTSLNVGVGWAPIVLRP